MKKIINYLGAIDYKDLCLRTYGMTFILKRDV